MKNFRNKMVIGLAAGAFALALPLAAQAQQAGGVSVGGVSVGGNGSGGLGVSADVGGVGASASIGGDSAADVDASVGGANGANASASVGGGSTADVDAGIGGAGGANASASVGAGGAPGASVDANVGNVTGDVDVTTGSNTGIAAALGFTSDEDDSAAPATPGTGTPGTAAPGTATPGLDPSMTSAIGELSDAELAAYKKKCVTILRSPAGFESDLVDLCKLVREAASR